MRLCMRKYGLLALALFWGAARRSELLAKWLSCSDTFSSFFALQEPWQLRICCLKYVLLLATQGVQPTGQQQQNTLTPNRRHSCFLFANNGMH